MGYTRGISDVEERARTTRDIEHITRRKKPWDEHKFDGRYICDVCGDFIRTKKGDVAERHVKKTVIISRGKTDTFWTHRHKKCGPEEEEPEMDRLGNKGVKTPESLIGPFFYASFFNMYHVMIYPYGPLPLELTVCPLP